MWTFSSVFPPSISTSHPWFFYLLFSPNIYSDSGGKISIWAPVETQRVIHKWPGVKAVGLPREGRRDRYCSLWLINAHPLGPWEALNPRFTYLRPLIPSRKSVELQIHRKTPCFCTVCFSNWIIFQTKTQMCSEMAPDAWAPERRLLNARPAWERA